MRRILLPAAILAGCVVLTWTLSLAGEGPNGLTDNRQLLPRFALPYEKQPIG